MKQMLPSELPEEEKIAVIDVARLPNGPDSLGYILNYQQEGSEDIL
jgi:hypothetical protein